jgi:hypothetical protein
LGSGFCPNNFPSNDILGSFPLLLRRYGALEGFVQWFEKRVTAPGRDPKDAAFNHSAYFQVDEETFAPGIEMMTRLAFDFPERQSR